MKRGTDLQAPRSGGAWLLPDSDGLVAAARSKKRWNSVFARGRIPGDAPDTVSVTFESLNLPQLVELTVFAARHWWRRRWEGRCGRGRRWRRFRLFVRIQEMNREGSWSEVKRREQRWKWNGLFCEELRYLSNSDSVPDKDSLASLF